MKENAPLGKILYSFSLIYILLVFFSTTGSRADGYDEVMKQGKLRHLGVPYAHFVTGSGDGFSVELIQLFAEYLGVRYEYVETSWEREISDLIGRETAFASQNIIIGKPVEIRGDLIANGLTSLPWRQKAILYSVPVFPSGVWIIARADFPGQPIVPSGNSENDIKSTIDLVKGYSAMAIEGGCLDPAMNRLQGSGIIIKIVPATMNLNELIPAVMNNEADCTLIDFPDALVGLQKWPGKIKVLGPVCMDQYMGVGFAKTSVRLRDEFNIFFSNCVRNGKYEMLVNKYYSSVFLYHPSFFDGLVRSYGKQ